MLCCGKGQSEYRCVWGDQPQERASSEAEHLDAKFSQTSNAVAASATLTWSTMALGCWHPGHHPNSSAPSPWSSPTYVSRSSCPCATHFAPGWGGRGAPALLWRKPTDVQVTQAGPKLPGNPVCLWEGLLESRNLLPLQSLPQRRTLSRNFPSPALLGSLGIL